MQLSKLILAEITGRPVNFLLGVLAIATASALFVVGPTLVAGYGEETRVELAQWDTELADLQSTVDANIQEEIKKTKRIMRDLGVNLRIVHKDTNMGSFYTDYKAVYFPEDYVRVLAESPNIETIVHLVATLQEKISWNNRSVLLVGMMPVLTTSQKNEEKPHMAQAIEPGTVVVGHELGDGLKQGDTLDILGHEFKIAEIRPQAGTREDIHLILNLHDAQRVVEHPGKIHQILALNCKCQGDRISAIRRDLQGVLQDTKVTEDDRRATAREKQRDLVEKNGQEQIAMLAAKRESWQQNRERWESTISLMMMVTLPLLVLVSAVFVGLMTWLNVRERRTEIGLLRALGKGTGNIAGLFLVKSVVAGVLGGVLGCGVCLIAYAIAAAMQDQDSLGLTVSHFWPATTLLVATVLGAPLVAAMSAYLPMLSAISQDPAVVLMEQ